MHDEQAYELTGRQNGECDDGPRPVPAPAPDEEAGRNQERVDKWAVPELGRHLGHCAEPPGPLGQDVGEQGWIGRHQAVVGHNALECGPEQPTIGNQDAEAEHSWRAELSGNGDRPAVHQRRGQHRVLTLAAGSILFVIIQLIGIALRSPSRSILHWGVLTGLALGFVTDMVVNAGGA